ncbi:MAG: 2-hydroxyacid dehydrogenase [Cytophagaceae bacterium]
MKVIVFSAKNFEKEYLIASNQANHDLQFCDEALNISTCHKAEGSDAVLIFTNDDGSAAVLDELKKSGVKYIAIRAAGYDQVNIPYAHTLGFMVANVPEYSPYAIAEHTIAIMLALNRHLVQADRQVKEYDFRLDQLIGFDMHQKTVGIIGMGKIGKIVAKILSGFGCRILAFDISKDEEAAAKYGIEYSSLEILASSSDIITIHVPLNAQTKYLINKDLIGKMKKGVMLINTGRGPILKTTDVLDALKSGHIGYLGLDVYEHEKGLFFYDHSTETLQDDLLARLLSFKNVLITGHQAFLTKTALENIADASFYTIGCWAKGKPSPNELK